jgi:hypothetical protein
MPFAVHPHMLRHGCGYALANAGHDTRALQAWLGHKNIQHTVRYTELALNVEAWDYMFKLGVAGDKTAKDFALMGYQMDGTCSWWKDSVRVRREDSRYGWTPLTLPLVCVAEFGIPGPCKWSMIEAVEERQESNHAHNRI